MVQLGGTSLTQRFEPCFGQFKERCLGLLKSFQGQAAELSRRIGEITSNTNTNQQQLIAGVIQLLDPTVVVDTDEGADGSRFYPDEFLKELGLEQDQDVKFFRDLMAPIEHRSQYWPSSRT